MEDTVHSRQGGVKELPVSSETKLTTLNSGENVSGKAVRQRAPPGRAWRRWRLVKVGWWVVARTSRKPLRGASKSTDLSSAEREV